MPLLFIHHAQPCEHQGIVAVSIFVGMPKRVRGNATDQQPRELGLQRFWIPAARPGAGRRQIVNEYVGPREQRVEGLAIGFFFEVENDALLASIPDRETGQGACWVAVRGFNLEDFRARFREQHAREGRCDTATTVEYAKVREDSASTHVQLTPLLREGDEPSERLAHPGSRPFAVSPGREVGRDRRKDRP